jgi:hypothetical protein
LPQYNDEKKEEGLKLGAGGEVDFVQKQQLDEVRKKLQAVKQESYPLPILALLMSYYLEVHPPTLAEMVQFKRPECFYFIFIFVTHITFV